MTYLASLFSIVGSMLVANASGVSNQLMGGAAAVAIVGGIASAVFTAKARAERNALRSAVEIAQGSADAWKSERDAEVAKADRLSQSLREEEAARRAAEARTDLTRTEAQIAQNQKDVLTILGRLEALIEQSLRSSS